MSFCLADRVFDHVWQAIDDAPIDLVCADEARDALTRAAVDARAARAELRAAMRAGDDVAADRARDRVDAVSYTVRDAIDELADGYYKDDRVVVVTVDPNDESLLQRAGVAYVMPANADEFAGDDNDGIPEGIWISCAPNDRARCFEHAADAALNAAGLLDVRMLRRMSASYAVQVNGMCASQLTRRKSRAFAAAADAARARPDAVVCVVRYRRDSINPETVAIVSRPEPIAQSGPVLPGESATPTLPSHGTAAPKLPQQFTIETYRGCAAGWQPTVTRGDRAAADRLLTLVGRIRNDRIHRISAT